MTEFLESRDYARLEIVLSRPFEHVGHAYQLLEQCDEGQEILFDGDMEGIAVLEVYGHFHDRAHLVDGD